MSLADFFSPVNLDKLTPKAGFYSSQLGNLIDIHSASFPDIEGQTPDIALIGILDDRHAQNNQGCALSPDYIREKFYSLYSGPYQVKIADLGNIKAGEKVSDTYAAVKLVVSDLVRKNIMPVILGGGQDITYAQYLAYEKLEQKVDLVVIDSHFDLDETDEDSIEATSGNYLNKIFLHQPNYLFNYSNIGYQTYFVNQDSLRVMEKLYFDVHRLGDFSGKVHIAEPIIRNANLISFDISAIRSSDACANGNATPNGFYGEEACQIMRYAGMSDKLSSIGLYEFNPAFDQNGQTATLLAQMLWYLTDGYYNRKKDFPLQPKSQYLIYKTSLKNNQHELVFVKSKKSDRWWMQVPYPVGVSKNERFHLVPCQYEDYQVAVSGEMPDLWWRTYQKLV
ncbi:arginase [Pedobacter sp. HMF7647]|uniref:Arginase n=1 Tax=Hufsiella arboris TaxID=2695275 RepID=A0A7K1Y4B5_9SPHI|nr:formimidoylglutamase [Hufsiella arboris]MXV49423.1 arginase [Hufsiella arboris]